MNYSKSVAAVLRLLANFGTSVTLTQKSNSTYNPTLNSQTITETTRTISGVRLEYSLSNIDGETIKQGDVRCLIEPTYEPKVGDTVTFTDAEYTIINVSTVQPADIVVYYELQLRK